MVKVLENKIIDLDLLPGQAQIDLQRQFRQQLDGAKTVTAGQLAQATKGSSADQNQDDSEGEGEGEGLEKGQVQIPREMLPDSMNEEEKNQARGFAGTIVDGSGKVVGGLAGTVGGVLKGVGDTGANVVYDLGSGLGGIGTGLAGGLTKTATAPFAGQGNEKAAAIAETSKPQGGEDKKKAGPRKIEIRSEKDKA
ncbi:hypothetical protein E2P81_ATG04573 [Venturia nashicola]|uniref:Uncharacterized protein n=1 Tax=Venturia nashicola TaxID=86259 RepID=A0A4Z1PGK3_9PEZI|nr:hypothetical protein E6O75_ATG04682 [Venturia nashicola]TLD34408.1 hypothetical protein E2P81_ATG04573 [Venturia nashicola]